MSYFIGPSSGVAMVRSPLRADDHDGDNTRRAYIVVGAIFIISLVAMFYIYLKFPELEP